MEKKRNILPIMAVLCLVCVVGMLVILCHPGSQVGTFSPPPFDGAAQVGTPTVPEGLGWRELDATVYRVSICGKLAAGNYADVWLTNPESNDVWLKLRVLDDDGNILGETGLLRPGEYVQRVELNKALEAGTALKLKIMGYEPETYESAGSVTLNVTVGGASQ